MEPRRRLEARWSAVALIAAAAVAGCGSGEGPSAGDAAGLDLGVETDTGSGVDTGVGTDTGNGSDTGATDGGGLDAGDAGDAGSAPDGGDGGGDGGALRRLRAGSSLVSAGTLMRSARFQMISTLGGRSLQQTTLQSPNFRLRGGLVGTIGAR